MALINKAGILNAAYDAKAPTDKRTDFTQFPKLPPELRRAIWNTSLKRWRMITVRIAGPDDSSSDNGSTQESREHQYQVMAHQRYRHTKLLRVCREARAAALEFYSVHLPCANLAATPLYLSPCYDVLSVRQKSQSLQRVVSFLNSLQTCDSKGSGVFNLALESSIFEDLRGVDGLEPAAREAFVQTVARLRRLWAVNLEIGEARVMAGELSWRHAGVHHNRSVPVFSYSQNIDWLATDPRPIDFDLGYIATFRDPRQQALRWQELEENLQIQRSRPLDFRILLSAHTQGCNIEVIDRNTAQRYFEEEERSFLDNACKMFEPNVPSWGQYLDRNSWEELSGSLQDAVGFWLFSKDAFDQYPDDGMCQLKRVRDLRDTPPQLCLFDLQ